MRYRALPVLLFSAAALCGCREGVLDPKGPVAEAERLMMTNSLAIMLVVVVPVIVPGICLVVSGGQPACDA
jgi:heme/copper-type cytochrome/quinol oxidase subunit 2